MKKYLHKAIESVVDATRETAIITNIANVSGTTYQVDTEMQGLSRGDYVSFVGTDGFNKTGYKVSSTNNTGFRISTNENPTLGAFGSWVARAWYFEHGADKEVSNIIARITSSNSKLKDTFPLVWLVDNYTESNDNTLRFQSQIENLTVVFINRTKEDKRTSARYTDNYEPIIDPYFADFLEQLNRDEVIFTPRGGFDFTEDDKTLYDKEINTNKFTSFTDAKIVTFNNIFINKTLCK